MLQKKIGFMRIVYGLVTGLLLTVLVSCGGNDKTEKKSKEMMRDLKENAPAKEDVDKSLEKGKEELENAADSLK